MITRNNLIKHRFSTLYLLDNSKPYLCEYHLNLILYVLFYLNNSYHLLYKLTHTSSYINTHNQPSNQHQHSQKKLV